MPSQVKWDRAAKRSWKQGLRGKALVETGAVWKDARGNRDWVERRLETGAEWKRRSWKQGL